MTPNSKRTKGTVHVISPKNLPALKLELSRVFQQIVLDLPPASALDFTDWLLGQARELSGHERVLAVGSNLNPSPN